MLYANVGLSWSLQDEYRQEAGSVVEVDYYNATSLLGLTDEELIQRTLHTYLAACQPTYGLCQVLDASVLRYSLICIRTASQAIYFVVIGLLYKVRRWLPATHAEAKALPCEGASALVMQAKLCS